MNTIVTTNRHKDIMKWRALALEYEMKISYLERALAQEESKLRIAEQVLVRPQKATHKIRKKTNQLIIAGTARIESIVLGPTTHDVMLFR